MHGDDRDSVVDPNSAMRETLTSRVMSTVGDPTRDSSALRNSDRLSFNEFG
jgi:hypothetical protein